MNVSPGPGDRFPDIETLCNQIANQPNNKAAALVKLLPLITPSDDRLYTPSVELLIKFCDIVLEDYWMCTELVNLVSFVFNCMDDLEEESDGIGADGILESCCSVTSSSAHAHASTSSSIPILLAQHAQNAPVPLDQFADTTKRVNYSFAETVLFKLSRPLVFSLAKSGIARLFESGKANIETAAQFFTRLINDIPVGIRLLAHQLPHFNKSAPTIVISGLCPKEKQHIVHGLSSPSFTSRFVVLALDAICAALGLAPGALNFLLVDAINECVHGANGRCNFSEASESFEAAQFEFAMVLGLLKSEGFRTPTYIISFGQGSCQLLFGGSAWNKELGRMDIPVTKKLLKYVGENETILGSCQYHLATMMNPQFTKLETGHGVITQTTYRGLFFLDAIVRGIGLALPNRIGAKNDLELIQLLVNGYNEVAYNVGLKLCNSERELIKYPIIENGGGVFGSFYREKVKALSALGGVRSSALQRIRETPEETSQRFREYRQIGWNQMVKDLGEDGTRKFFSDAGHKSIATSREKDPFNRDPFTAWHQDFPEEAAEKQLLASDVALVTEAQRSYYHRMTAFYQQFPAKMTKDGENPQPKLFGKGRNTTTFRLKVKEEFPGAQNKELFQFKLEANSKHPVFTPDAVRLAYPNWSPADVAGACNIGVVITRTVIGNNQTRSLISRHLQQHNANIEMAEVLLSLFKEHQLYIKMNAHALRIVNNDWSKFKYIVQQPFSNERFVINNIPVDIRTYPYSYKRNVKKIQWRRKHEDAKMEIKEKIKADGAIMGKRKRTEE